LPGRLADRHREALTEIPVVTWEEVLDAYAGVASRYWLSVLDDALRRHEELESISETFGANADARLSGQEIWERWADGDTTYVHMGRVNGLNGAELAEDISSGAWRARKYEVRSQPLEQKNWFPIADFIAILGEQQ
jgi:hypothetical protein